TARMTKNFVRRFSERHLLATILLLALLVRLPFLIPQFQPSADLVIFIRWVRLIQAQGLANSYNGTGIDYPPLSLYWLAARGWLESPLPAAMRNGDDALTVLLKLPSIVADVGTTWLIALALRNKTPWLRLLACALWAFNPAIWYIAAYWAQLDAVYSLFL